MPDLQVVAPAPAQTALSRLVDDYLASCRARGLSPRTVDGAYGYPLRQVLLPFCQREGIKEPAELNNRALVRLTNELLERTGPSGRPLSRHSVHAYMRAINHLISWAAGEGEEIKAKAPLPRLPKRLVDVLSRDEIARMEDVAKAERDKVVIRVLADTGIRVGELVALRPADLVTMTRGNFLKIQGKGARERLVPISPGLYRRLQRYADRSRPADTRSDRLFLALRRSVAGDFEPLTVSGVSQLLKVNAEAARIRKRVHPHLLRHSFATWALTRGMNPLTLAQILGHSSLAMIQNVYAHLTPADSYDALLKALSGD